MNVGLYAAQIQSTVMRHREGVEQTYEKYPDSHLFWCFMDLADSSNYRLATGARKGYVRGETFLSLVSAVIAPCEEIWSIKELGDGVLLASLQFRPLLESALLVDQAASQLAAVAGEERWPFKVRVGLGYGIAKKLNRRNEDYLGTSIDQLARVMAVRSEDSNILVDERVIDIAGQVLEEYAACVTASESTALGPEAAKGMLEDIYYRALRVDRQELVEFREHFVPWKEALERVGSEDDW